MSSYDFWRRRRKLQEEIVRAGKVDLVVYNTRLGKTATPSDYVTPEDTRIWDNYLRIG